MQALKMLEFGDAKGLLSNNIVRLFIFSVNAVVLMPYLNHKILLTQLYQLGIRKSLP